MRAAMAGRLTSRELVSQYLVRLGIYEDRLHAAIAVNPHALEEADGSTASAPPAGSAGRCTAFPSR